MNAGSIAMNLKLNNNQFKSEEMLFFGRSGHDATTSLENKRTVVVDLYFF